MTPFNFAPIFQKVATIAVFALLLPRFSQAQTHQSHPDFREAQRKMQEFQRQMMQHLQQNLGAGGFNAMPDSNFFQFKIDTTFDGGAAQFFQMTPFGLDSMMRGEPFGDSFFDQFFQLPNAPRPPKPSAKEGRPQGNMPDGSQFLDEKGDADLLPEERLRQELAPGNPAEPAPTPPSEPTKPEKPAKPKRATVRI